MGKKRNNNSNKAGSNSGRLSYKDFKKQQSGQQSYAQFKKNQQEQQRQEEDRREQEKKQALIEQENQRRLDAVNRVYGGGMKATIDMGLQGNRVAQQQVNNALNKQYGGAMKEDATVVVGVVTVFSGEHDIATFVADEVFVVRWNQKELAFAESTCAAIVGEVEITTFPMFYMNGVA